MTTGDQEPQNGADDIEASRMTLGEHLDELRSRLRRASIVFAVVFVTLYGFRETVHSFIHMPYEKAWSKLEERLVEVRREQVEADPSLLEEHFIKGDPEWELRDPRRTLGPKTTLQPGGPFFVKIRECFLLSLFIAGPVLLWEIWMFVAAGLYKQEKRVVYSFLPPSLGLFFAGVAFGFTTMVPAAIFFTQSDGLGIDDDLRQVGIGEYLAFLQTLALALGVIFQLPIFQIALSRTGVVDPAVYAKLRGHVVILLLVFAAVITPPDPVTQVLLAGPAVVLWEIGYWCSRLVWKGERTTSGSDELPAATGA